MDKKPGDRVSHYRLVERLGAGGMGVVYKAQDIRLDRFAALKFLPPQLQLEQEDKLRFIQEAKLTSSLDHPNICTIYEIDETESGELFIAMALYEGETLRQRIKRGPLSLEEALEFGGQVCDGLSKAHAKGIVHRDIKPDNLIITNDRIVKIVDFGISKLTGSKGLTQPGTPVGTPGYMSPEQARGVEVDHRTDIWSVGVILFKMLTCHLPFQGDTDLSLMYSIVNEDPPPLSSFRRGISELVEDVIRKALTKEVGLRYQDVNDLRSDLTRAVQGDPAVAADLASRFDSTPSIAVVPLRDMSYGQDHAYLAEGLAESITTRLTRLSGLRVVSHNSVFCLWERTPDIAVIGRELGVQSVLEGSIRTAGSRIRVSIRLVSSSDGFLIWADEFNGELESLFELEDKISRRVVEALELKLTPADGPEAESSAPENPEAYTAYLKGRFHWNRRTVAELKKSIGYFTEAIDLDPGYAPAYAGLADAYIILGMYGAFPPRDVMPRAQDSAIRALETNGRLAEAHISRGCVEAVFGWQWRSAEREFKRGLQFNPNYATGHHWYAVNYLTPLLRFDEARQAIRRALRLDPVSLAINVSVGLIESYARNFNAAIECFQSTLEMDSNFPTAHLFLAQAYTQTSQFEKALSHSEKALKSYGQSANMLALRGHIAAAAGEKQAAEQGLKDLSKLSDKQFVSSYDIALVLAGLGSKEKAVQRLLQAVDERAYLLVYLGVEPMLDGLRSHPSFDALVGKVFGGILP